MSYTRFSFEKQFTKLMLKYVLYSLFLGSTAAASLSGTGKEIPSNASAYHVFKKLLSPLKDKKKKSLLRRKMKMQMCHSLVTLSRFRIFLF